MINSNWSRENQSVTPRFGEWRLIGAESGCNSATPVMRLEKITELLRKGKTCGDQPGSGILLTDSFMLGAAV